MEVIRSALSAHAEPAAEKAVAEIAMRSPTSVKLKLRALRQSARLEPCLDQEFGLALACMRLPDFGLLRS